MSHRPWSSAKKFMRPVVRRLPPEPIKKWQIVKGDLVEVIDGKDVGKQGIIRGVIRAQNKVIVEGVNMVCSYAAY